MADPISMMAIVSMGTAAAGAVTGAIGKSYEGQANSQMYTYQAGVAQMNQQIQKQNADYARDAGEVEAQESGLKTRAQIGTQKATQAAGSLDVNTGSALDVRTSQHDVGLEDQAIIRSSAAKRAFGFETEAASAEAQAKVNTMAASRSRTSGTIGVVSSLIGGASSVSSKWMDASRQGIPGFGSGSTPATHWYDG